VPSTESSGSAVLKPTLTTVDVKPSLSGTRQDDVLVPQVIGQDDVRAPQVVCASTPSELLCAGVASTDDTSRAESPPSVSEDVTGYC